MLAKWARDAHGEEEDDDGKEARLCLASSNILFSSWRKNIVYL